MLTYNKRKIIINFLLMYLLHNGPVTFFFEQVEIIKMETKRKQV